MFISYRSKPDYLPITAVPADTCCDICNPCLFDVVRPAKPVTVRRNNQAKRGHPVSFVREALYSWRRTIKKELYPLAMWGPQAILDSANCELLSSVGPIKTIGQLEKLLKTNWARWEVLGLKLFDMMSQLDIPELARAPRLTSAKRTAAAADLNTSEISSAGSSAPGTSKRRRPAPIDNTAFPDSAYDTFWGSSSRRYASVRVAEPHELLKKGV